MSFDKILTIGFLAFTIALVWQINPVAALECYICSNQTGDSEKCQNTIKTCEPNENVCQTEIRWGIVPYFSEGAQYQYYVSKRCANRRICEKTRSHYMSYCTHIWYENWICYDCCLGDRCNYYVINGGGVNILSNKLATMIVLLYLLDSKLFQFR